MRDTVSQILDGIDNAKKKAGRTDEVTLVAVSKTHPWSAVEEALKAGLTTFGENRVQELSGKFPLQREGYTLRLIGHLQSNKVRQVIPYVDAIDSVDSLKLLKSVNKEAARVDTVMPVLLQVNTSGEVSKSGFESAEDVYRCLDEASGLSSVQIEGLMTIGPLTSDEYAIRTSFADLKRLQGDLQGRYPELSFRELSMGMSSDYLIAVEMGSTMVRVGSLLFGARDYT